MPKKSSETKGPVGEETSSVSSEIDLSNLVAAQAKMGELLMEMTPMIVATAAKSDDLARRVEGLERAMLGLVETVRQIYGVLQEALTIRRL